MEFRAADVYRVHRTTGGKEPDRMGIVRFALRFPHTFYVVAALILFLGGVAAYTMRTDIFPEIRIPVVTVIWQYTGLSTPEMEQRVTTYSQYSISSNVNGIKDIEAQTMAGLSVQKIFFQPDVNLDLAISQIVAATNSIRSLMPAGIQPPIVVQFNASSVPVLQISLSSDTLNEQELYDYGIYRMRQQLAPIPGVTLPTPTGGKYRQIMVDIDLEKLVAHGLTPLDIVNAVNAQNLTLPSGTAKIGDTQYTVLTNAMPATIDDLNNIPVKVVNGATVFLKDIGQVHDGWLVQQNVVRRDGQRSVLLSIIKNGNASTLDVVNAVVDTLKTARAAAPRGMHIDELFDQSVFVKQSIQAVLREGAIAAALTALMIVLFLGSWRSTLVVMTSIPLAILTSLVVLYFLGETINTMTLGGLALAVGILVDDSTVTIENTHRLLHEEGMPLPQATLHGAAGIAVPTLVSTLAISCVFTSVIFLEGPAKFLFTPLGLAVVFAMLASYGLSRTLTPIMIGLLTKGEQAGGNSWFGRFHHGFERSFERLRGGYVELLAALLRNRLAIPAAAVVVLALGGTLYFFVGRDFFPAIDGGQIQLHVRAPAGMRIEATERVFQAVEDKIREVIPERDRRLIVDNIGLPARVYNLAFTDGSTIGVNDGVILVALNDGHAPTADYVRRLRKALPAAFPEVVFYFQAADMVTQILNFGLPAQIDVRTVGYDRANNLRVAKELRRRIADIPGVVDAHLQQEVDGSRLPCQDRPHARRPARPQCHHHRQQPQRQPELLGTGHAQLLDRSGERHPLLHYGADARAQRQLPQRRRQHAGYGQPGGRRRADNGGDNRRARRSDPRPAQQRRHPAAQQRADQRQPGQHPAGLRGLCQRAGTRPGQRRRRHRQDHRRARQGAEARQHHPGHRADRQHDDLVCRSRHRSAVRRGVRLLPDGGELPELRRPVRRAARPAGDPLRHPHHAVRDRHHAQRAVADGRDHGGRRRLGKLDPAGDLRPRAAARRQAGARGGARRRPHPHPPGADDGRGDDRRHGADGDRRRRRGAERGAGACRHRRPVVRDADHLAGRALVVRQAARQQRRQDRARRLRGGSSMTKRSLLAIVAAATLAGTVGAGAWSHLAQDRQVRAAAEERRNFVPAVRVAAVRSDPSDRVVNLPGTTLAFAAANIYARASGYIAKRNVDIGDRVKAGDLLVLIVAPELDHQIAQAEATLAQLRSMLSQREAARELAKVTWGRDKPVVKQGWLPQQQATIDEQTLRQQEELVKAARSNAEAQESQLKVLRQEKEYQSVIAPFDGVITQRNIDVGSLMQADDINSTFLFTLMHTDVIRTQVYVPQDAAFGVRPGIKAVIRVPEMPGRTFEGTVTRFATALQPGSRTLLTEVDIPNPRR